MVVQLRRTLEEKIKKSESLNQKQTENKKAEFEEAVNKAIKMVVLNSAIGILFKLPVLILPLINLIAQFYYRNHSYKYDHPSFDMFYSILFYGGFLFSYSRHFLSSLYFFIAYTIVDLQSI